MSQAAPGAAAPAPAQAKPAAATHSGAHAVRTPPDPKADVPRLLNRWQVIAVTASVLFAALTATLLVLSWQANRAAADNTEQLVRVQNIQSTLFRADALATTAFLVGGLEPPEQRKAYDDAIDDVTRQITNAAEAQPADRDALAALNQAVNDYTSTSTQARDNNRQGFPVGAEYLRTASNKLRADALPVLASLTEQNSLRAKDELNAQHPFYLLIPGVLALLVLWWVNGQLARRFRRRFNIGVAAAFVVVALLTVVSAATGSNQRDASNDLRSGSFSRAVNEASARTAANDAKSNESRRLGAQGSGAVFEEGWVKAAAEVDKFVSPQTRALWVRYTEAHKQIVDLDESGKYAEAVALATTTDDTGSSAALEAFDQAAQAATDQAATETTDTLRSGNTGILVLAILTLLLGLASAALSTWGIAQRRKEYS